MTAQEETDDNLQNVSEQQKRKNILGKRRTENF